MITPSSPEYACSDDRDNDNDGLTDYPEDPGCSSATDNDEYNAAEQPQTNTAPQIDRGPFATPSTVYADETALLTVDASDADGDALSYTWTMASGQGSVVGAGQEATYIPAAGSSQQSCTVRVRVSDGNGGTATGTVNLTVLPEQQSSGDSTAVAFYPVADASVNGRRSSANNGSSSSLEVDGSPAKIAYMRFNVAGLTGAVQSARVRLHVTNASSFGGTIYSISNNTWNESSLNFNNRPAIDGAALDALGKVNVGDIVELDVTDAIGGNGVFSFAIDSSSSNGAIYGSRESSNGAPELIITQAPTDEVSANLPPQIEAGPIVLSDTIFANETTELAVSASDPDGDRLTYTWSMNPQLGSISGNGEEVTFVPPSVSTEENFSASVTVSDGRGGSATATVNLTVLPAESGEQTQTEFSFIPEADAWVTDYHPNSNYGSADQLRVGGSPVKVIYLRFNVTGVYGAVESARLKFRVTNRSPHRRKPLCPRRQQLG